MHDVIKLHIMGLHIRAIGRQIRTQQQKKLFTLSTLGEDGCRHCVGFTDGFVVLKNEKGLSFPFG